MSFRRNGKSKHHERREWDAWKREHAELLARCGLPPGVLRSRGDWEYLLYYGYWCAAYYGAYINNIDFSLDELTPAQAAAFRELLTVTLSDEEKRSSVGWHRVCPPAE